MACDAGDRRAASCATTSFARSNVAHALRSTLAAALLVVVSVAAGIAPAMAGPFTRLQVLMPGETAAPGTSGGKTGSAAAQTAGVPFSITVRACDDTWTTVPTVTDVVSLLASDASATLPASAHPTCGPSCRPSRTGCARPTRGPSCARRPCAESAWSSRKDP